MSIVRFAVLVCVLPVVSFSQSITYNFSAPNAAHHEAEISVTADKLPAGGAYFMMSRSSPGRYAKHEFGKNVYNVKAVDENGINLPVEKTDADVYKISGYKTKATVTYTLFANYADGTYSGIDITGYHLNMPSAFMWVKGMEKAPISLQFTLLDARWKIATQLKPGSTAETFLAPDLQYFMDSPTKVGSLRIGTWNVTNPDGKQYTFRLALEATTTPEVFSAFAAKVEKMVKEAKAVFGELPAYDYGTYTFIASINPYVKGDGMEHRNSTMICLPYNFNGSDELLGVFSHEFFHCWNVERIRPADIEPFNFEKSNVSQGLWLAEGFTQYYGDLILNRSGFLQADAFVSSMEDLVNVKMNLPGAINYSPIENSERAVFVDAGVSIDKNNYANMYASYYTYGGAIALALDLSIRSSFPKKSLDDFMQELWKRFGKPAKPYTIASLQTALATITNNAFASNFFNKYIYGHEPVDYSLLLASAGISLQTANTGRAWAGGENFLYTRSQPTLGAATIINTPLYNAGIDVDDVITSLDGKNILNKKEFTEIVNSHKPGYQLPVTYNHRGIVIDSIITLAQNPEIILTMMPSVNNTQQNFKDAWLNSRQ